MVVLPSIIETKTVDFKTCDALEHLIIRHSMNEKRDAPNALKSVFSSIVALGFKAFHMGEHAAKEKHPNLPPVFGCAVFYWNTQTKIMMGLPIYGQEEKK
jgi:hypothetical protein